MWQQKLLMGGKSQGVLLSSLNQGNNYPNHTPTPTKLPYVQIQMDEAPCYFVLCTPDFSTYHNMVCQRRKIHVWEHQKDLKGVFAHSISIKCYYLTLSL